MAGATITGSTGNEYIDAKIVWSSVANNDTNKSTVTAALYYKRNNTGFKTYGTGTFSITINGTKTTETKTLTITESAWVKAVEATVTVSHNSNGSKSITISASGSIPDTTLTSTSVSGTANLDTIPRASTIDLLSCNTSYFTGTFTFKYTPQSNSFYNRCNIALNIDGTYTAVKTINLGQKAASQQTGTVTLSESELSTIYNKLPSAKKGTLRFTFRTYSDSGYSTQVGDAGNKEITLTIPNTTATQPTATMTLTPVSSLASPFNSLYIKGKSKVKATLASGAGKYGASIVSYNITVEGKSGGTPYTSGYLMKPGDVTVKGTVTDSRGYSRTYTNTITVIDYSVPQIIPISTENEVIAARCNSSGALTENGTYLKIKARRSFSKVVSSGVQKNFCSIRYRYKAEGGSYSSWAVILATSAGGDEVVTGALLGGALSTTSSYIVQVQAIDDIGESATTTISVPTEKVYMHRAGSINSLGIGKYAEEENTVDIAEDITLKVRGDLIVGDRKISDTGWISLGLSDEVIESANNVGQSGRGCYYRVINGNHVYVAFNCALTYANSILIVNKNAIPAQYCPERNAYALVPTGGRSIIRAIANHSGNIVIDWVQVITATASTTSANVSWIDGYLDYWI